MTLYRDDIQETIAYSNNTMGKSKAVTEELIRIKEDSLYRLYAMSGDTLSISDELIDSAIFPIKDSVSVTDTLVGRKRHVDMITEQIIVSDTFKTKLCAKSLIVDQISSETYSSDKQRVLSVDRLFIEDNFLNKKFSFVKLNETISVKDFFRAGVIFKDFINDGISILDRVVKQNTRAYTYDDIHFNEQYHHKKITRSLITESILVTGRCVARYSDFITDHVLHVEQYSQRLKVRQQVIDNISISENISQKRKVKQWLSESLSLTDVNQGKNNAKQWVTDLVFTDDDYSAERQYGYAWTSNVDTWAMSRYQDYGFSELAVIDGVLYGVAEDGLYRLDAHTFVDARMVTGQLDLGQGNLVHPVAAYLEYELAGDNRFLSVGVGTTQSGTKQTYTYNLPTEPSNYLTNGRVLFGRGLRGRHFSFEIKIGGLYGYINDFSIDMTATKRRI
ncbi:hypothetical protein [Acinetobacter towneri]|uniref:Uncharacterized protein n=1 Tax=Acinetobacter towneri TaxID=202956 RepID=A0A1E8E4T2_9GAMM|nr:hypothetical protein [Acinetobacter towneri]OFE44631.1 hypothetical protein BJN41_00440 [Acinetobacter towneri]